MRTPRWTRTDRRRAGTAITEAALVMIPLVFFLMLAPGVWFIWVNEQQARTEAHRDAFDKTTTLILIPEARPNPITSSHFGTITVSQREHAYPSFPPSLDDLGTNDPNDVLNLLKPPSGKQLIVGPQLIECFPDGLPNQPVEGWQYQPVQFRGGWWTGDVELLRYAAVVRSPWTWMGWPFVPIQDVYWEPKQVQGWYGSNEVDKPIKSSLKLMD